MVSPAIPQWFSRTGSRLFLTTPSYGAARRSGRITLVPHGTETEVAAKRRGSYPADRHRSAKRLVRIADRASVHGLAGCAESTTAPPSTLHRQGASSLAFLRSPRRAVQLKAVGVPAGYGAPAVGATAALGAAIVVVAVRPVGWFLTNREPHPVQGDHRRHSAIHLECRVGSPSQYGSPRSAVTPLPGTQWTSPNSFAPTRFVHLGLGGL
jgi:hypothetical protein